MRIAVISDTHLDNSKESRRFLSNLMENVFERVDLVIHAGDVVSHELLDVFLPYRCHVVRGNMDVSLPHIPIKQILDIQGFKIGLIHGWGPPEGIEERISAEFSDCELDCLVYGHSHVPVCHDRQGVLFFNPGSATDKRLMDYHSVGLLEIDARISGNIIRLD